MSKAALVKLPKIDPVTVKKAKEFVMTWGPAIAGALGGLLDKILGKKPLKDEIQRLQGDLDQAVGHIKALIAENESMAENIDVLVAEVKKLRSRLRIATIIMYMAAGITVILSVVLVIDLSGK